MAEVRVASTNHLDEATLTAARGLLDAAFEGDFTGDDWRHALGGDHVLVLQHGRLVAHGSLVPRALLHDGRRLHTGYVEAVAVLPDRQRRGLGGTVMATLERLVRGHYEVGALSATDSAASFYAARGWRAWRGPTFVLAPDGVRRTREDDGSVFVLPVSAALDLSGTLVSDWREGDVW